jgi:hypothetical protein
LDTPLVNTDNLRLLLNTSNFRQATTIAFICLLVALASIILCNHLLEIVMRSHVREMILADVRSQQLNGRLQKTEQVLAALAYRDPFETRKDRRKNIGTVELNLDSVEHTAVRRLSSAPELASTYAGGLAATLDSERVPQPEQAIYRALLTPSHVSSTPRMGLRGTVVIEAQAQSLAMRVWRSAMTVLIRESSF